jgi:hypothetical protein
MIGNRPVRVSDFIIPPVPHEALRNEWQGRPEAERAPDTSLTFRDDGGFSLSSRDTYPAAGLKIDFTRVVQKVSNLEADRTGRPKPAVRIEWTE